jgi:hypothetical protein
LKGSVPNTSNDWSKGMRLMIGNKWKVATLLWEGTAGGSGADSICLGIVERTLLLLLASMSIIESQTSIPYHEILFLAYTSPSSVHIFFSFF